MITTAATTNPILFIYFVYLFENFRYLTLLEARESLQNLIAEIEPD
ncbi:MAG: hypothetical protein V7L31_16295 [Nostoc sp.]